ncbi:MAG: CoA transferase [Chloroflexi bacterium]|nr:CoA transferase [Chloroflexota bacterium]
MNNESGKQNEFNGPLKDIHILDIGTGLAGPLVATLLADFGAEAIKIEMPGVGDWLRHIVPKYGDIGLWWVVDGRNKKAITLDLSKPAGQKVLKKMVPWADILVENYSPGTLEEWNLGYEVLRKLNPGLILVRCSGFGQEGPYRNRLAYDRIGQAFSGIVYRTGFPETPPVFAGLSIADYSTAAYAALGAMIALHYRNTIGNGQGQVVDGCLYESILRMYEGYVALYDTRGIIGERAGNIRPFAMPGGVFKTKDGRSVLITIVMDHQFGYLTEAMGRSDLAQEPLFQTREGRVQNQDFLNGLVGEWVATKAMKELMEISEKHRFPMAPIYNAKDICEDEHFRQRGSVVETEHPVLGKFKMQGVTPKLSLTPGKVKHAGRDLGEDTEEVLSRMFGYSQQEIQKLRAEKII